MKDWVNPCYRNQPVSFHFTNYSQDTRILRDNPRHAQRQVLLEDDRQIGVSCTSDVKVLSLSISSRPGHWRIVLFQSDRMECSPKSSSALCCICWTQQQRTHVKRGESLSSVVEVWNLGPCQSRIGSRVGIRERIIWKIVGARLSSLVERFRVSWS